MSVCLCVSVWFTVFSNVRVLASFRLCSFLVLLSACFFACFTGRLSAYMLTCVSASVSPSRSFPCTPLLPAPSECILFFLCGYVADAHASRDRQTHVHTGRHMGKHRETYIWARVSRVLPTRVVASCRVLFLFVWFVGIGVAWLAWCDWRGMAWCASLTPVCSQRHQCVNNIQSCG